MLFTLRIYGSSSACHVAPLSAEEYTPSRSPTQTVPLPSTASAEICISFLGSASACHVAPPSSEISSAPRLAAATVAFSDATNLHSSIGAAATTLHVVPLDALRSSPC